jgi:hypothetical protein
MRLTDYELHDLLRQEAPHIEVNHSLMSALMDSGNIFVVGKLKTFVCIKHNDKEARWELVMLS